MENSNNSKNIIWDWIWELIPVDGVLRMINIILLEVIKRLMTQTEN